MAQLATRRIADGCHQLGNRPAGGEAGGEPGLEARAGRWRRQRRAQDGRGIDQRCQLRPGGGLVSGQEAIDGLIQAFGRRAGGQAGSPRGVQGSSP